MGAEGPDGTSRVDGAAVWMPFLVGHGGLVETGGRGVEHLFGAVAGPGVADLCRATARGGIVPIHGLLSGQPTIFSAGTLPDPSMRSYTLVAMTHDEERLRRAGESVGAGLRSGDFAPRVDRVPTGLDTIVEAHEYLESNQQVGRIVVTPG